MSTTEQPQPLSRPAGGARPGSANQNLALAAAMLVLGLVLGAAVTLLVVSGDSQEDAFGATVERSGYQAVILSNDKVYFGRLTNESDTFFRLDDAYFLRETQGTDDAQPVRSLVPVNREIHAPENRMLIRKDSVVLIENLADDSPVLREIRRQEGGAGARDRDGDTTTTARGETTTTTGR